MKLRTILLTAFLSITLLSCRDETYVNDEPGIALAPPNLDTKFAGFYVVNEGNMGMNAASIDYFDYTTGRYQQDFYTKQNPNQINELGDVANDILVYGEKTYVTVNVSNYVEVFETKTGKHIKQIHIPNCRYLISDRGNVYVSSYAGKVDINPNAEKGIVAQIDTISLNIIQKEVVGYQPEMMAIANNKLYVANSGGYRVPNYDTTVSVIDLDSFKEINKIEVAPNLHTMAKASSGEIYVSSRGDYYNIAPNLYVIDPTKDEVIHNFDIPVSNMTIDDHRLYFYSSVFSYETQGYEFDYGIIDTNTKELLEEKYISDNTEKNIVMPYGIAVNPETKEVILSDAIDFVGSGFVYCFSAQGKLNWKTTAGNIPARITFIYK